MSDGIAKALRGLKDNSGLPLWTGEQLLGYSVAVSPDIPAPGANAKSIMFGDWASSYGVRRVAQLGLQRLSEIRSANGQVEFRLFERVDGNRARGAEGTGGSQAS